jgi:tetratricopeptide (TPR) repeat protein
VAEHIEDKAFTECIRGRLDSAVRQLTHISGFFERMVDKNEEICRDLADVYELIGELHQSAGRFAESLPWLEKAIIVDENYDAAYHELALSYIETGKPECAIRCLEGEVNVAPDNKCAYLLLADLYRGQGDDTGFERSLSRLLEQVPSDVEALDKLIRFYDRQGKSVETELLRRRLVATRRELSPAEFTIWRRHADRIGADHPDAVGGSTA